MNFSRTLKSIVAVVSLAMSGCVSDTPLRLIGVFPIDMMGTCTVAEDVFISSGQIEMSTANAGVICLGVENAMVEQGGITVEGEQIDDPSGRTIIYVEEVLHTYSTTPAISLPAETLREGLVVRAAGKAGVIVALMGDQAAQALVDNTVAGDKVDVLVTLRVRGRLASGGTITSAPFTWPFRVTRK